LATARRLRRTRSHAHEALKLSTGVGRMRCPQCGHINDSAAHVCINCASLLPLMPPSAPPRTAWPELSPAPGQIVDANASAATFNPQPTEATETAQEAPLPSWLAGPSDAELQGRGSAQRTGEHLGQSGPLGASLRDGGAPPPRPYAAASGPMTGD